MQGKFLGQRNGGNLVVSSLIQLQRALILELLNDPLLDFDDGSVGIDKMIVKDLSQSCQRMIG